MCGRFEFNDPGMDDKMTAIVEKMKFHFEITACPICYLCGIYQMVDGVYRFVVPTRLANESMAEIHHRIPVIIEASEVRSYLTDYGAARKLLRREAPLLWRQQMP